METDWWNRELQGFNSSLLPLVVVRDIPYLDVASLSGWMLPDKTIKFDCDREAEAYGR